MDKHPLRESLWRRGWNDTKAIWTSWPFYILDAVVAVVIGGVFGWYWGLAIVIFGTICVWMGATARASVKQRDEARELVEQQRKPSDSEVADTIRLLEAETLVLKNNEEEECSYSFSQVFLALADQLSSGISSIHFESQILKGLDLDSEWFLPHDDEGSIRLIAMLHQNTLIDRSTEEHQHLVPDYSQGDFNQGITVFTKPKWLPEKGIEAKYFLSPFGVTVVQQLRQQSTAHKKGSQTE